MNHDSYDEIDAQPRPDMDEVHTAVSGEGLELVQDVGSIDIGEDIAVTGLLRVPGSPLEARDSSRPFLAPKTPPPSISISSAAETVPSKLSQREQRIMDTVRDPATFRDTVLGYFMQGEYGFQKLPRKEILRLLHGRSYKLLSPEVTAAINNALDDLVLEGVLIKKTFPGRTKKIRDTVYLHLDPTIEHELRELSKTPLAEEVPKQVPQNPSVDDWEPEPITDNDFERMLGPFKGGPDFKPRNKGRRDDRRRR